MISAPLTTSHDWHSFDGAEETPLIDPGRLARTHPQGFRRTKSAPRGGHNIPAETIERRYFRSVRNLLNEYAASCSLAICYDNSLSELGIIFQQVGKDREVLDPQRYESLRQVIEQ